MLQMRVGKVVGKQNGFLVAQWDGPPIDANGVNPTATDSLEDSTARPTYHAHLTRLVTAIRTDNQCEIKNEIAHLKKYTIPVAELYEFKPHLPDGMFHAFVRSVTEIDPEDV